MIICPKCYWHRQIWRTGRRTRRLPLTAGIARQANVRSKPRSTKGSRSRSQCRFHAVPACVGRCQLWFDSAQFDSLGMRSATVSTDAGPSNSRTAHPSGSMTSSGSRVNTLSPPSIWRWPRRGLLTRPTAQHRLGSGRIRLLWTAEGVDQVTGYGVEMVAGRPVLPPEMANEVPGVRRGRTTPAQGNTFATVATVWRRRRNRTSKAKGVNTR